MTAPRRLVKPRFHARPHWGRLALALAMVLAAAELTGRWFDVDFSGQRARAEAIPIFYRKPTMADGEAYFRRPGPQLWQGRVLRSGLAAQGYPRAAEVYAHEPVLQILYDKDGFRNPPGLDDWEVVLVGDGFVELGHLADKDLISWRLAEHLKLRVKNLGVNFTGPLTHGHYLERFGVGPSTRHGVLAFSEATALERLLGEAQYLQRVRDGVLRHQSEEPTWVRQSSLVLAVGRGLASAWSRPPGPDRIDAYFASPTGEVPITLMPRPGCPAAEPEPSPATDVLAPTTRGALDAMLAEYRRIATEHHITPWLIFMPEKHRVLRGKLHYTAETGPTARHGPVSRLPEVLKALCTRHEIAFVDPTPALAAAAGDGDLPYNGYGDPHLNTVGARVVAEVLAKALRSASPRFAHQSWRFLEGPAR